MTYTFCLYAYSPEDCKDTGTRAFITADSETDALMSMLMQAGQKNPAAFANTKEFLVYADGPKGCLVWAWEEHMNQKFPPA